MSLLKNVVFSSVLLGHMVVDVLNGTRGVLLAYWSVPLGLANSTIGLISTLYAFSSSLAQPIFGYISDKFGARWVAAGGILWMAIFFSLALIVPGQIAILFLILASMGSGAFHPAGAAQATLVARSGLNGREASAASFFFLFGQSGWFLGPLLGGTLLDSMSQFGLLILVIALIPVGIFAAVALRSAQIQSHPKPSVQVVTQKAALLPMLAVIFLAAFQAWAQSNVVTFMPKYLADLGHPASLYGLLTSLFMGGSAVGNLIGGNLADRLGKPRVIFSAMALAVIPLFLLGQANGDISWFYLLIPLAGAFTGASFPVIVVLAQNLVPVGTGLASGLVMGFSFSAGAAGSWLSGVMADQAGIPPVWLVSAAICLISTILALLVRENRPMLVSVASE